MSSLLLCIVFFFLELYVAKVMSFSMKPHIDNPLQLIPTRCTNVITLYGGIKGTSVRKCFVVTWPESLLHPKNWWSAPSPVEGQC